MINNFKKLLICFILVIIQVSIINNGLLLNFYPNILLIYTIFISQKLDSPEPMILSIILGIMYDSLLSPNFGIRTLTFFLVSILINNVRGYIFDENYKTAIFYVLIGVFLYNFIINIIYFFLSYNINFQEILSNIFSIETLLSIFIFMLFQNEFEKFYLTRKEKIEKEWSYWNQIKEIFLKDLK